MLPNWESGCQNQPRANVAVSTTAGAAASISGTGIRVTVGCSQPVSEADIPASKPQGQRFMKYLPLTTASTRTVCSLFYVRLRAVWLPISWMNIHNKSYTNIRRNMGIA